ncbi:MAG: universal stress protein [Burkholderiales bacterium]|nr:universal stress protein [Burkholderiales bacterium]
MLKLLVAVDGSENGLRAVRHVADLARRGIRVEAVLLNVQPPVMSGEVGAIAPAELAEEVRAAASAEALRTARALLAEAPVPAVEQVATGDPAQAIVSAAEAARCDGIVIGRRGLGLVASLALGSVSSQVLRLATLPVTVVK